MKILRVFREGDVTDTHPALTKELKRRYDYTEVSFSDDMEDEERAEVIRNYDVLLTSWGSPKVPDCLAENPGNLKYLCNIVGGMRGWISETLVNSPYLQVSNWGDAPGFGIAEGAFALLMTMLKEIPVYINHAKEGNFGMPQRSRQGTLYGTNVGIYGVGAIGKRFIDMLRPFGSHIYAFDPFVETMPEGVIRVKSLDELCNQSQILVIHAPLTDDTRGSITKEHLASLPDGGIVINTARGAILDQDALLEELRSGRLRAGLDVMVPEGQDMPERDDPIRHAENVVFTAHHVGGAPWNDNPEKLNLAEEICLRNLEHFHNNEPLEFKMTPERYKRST